jgi:ATP-dependent Clp protease adaptor protein ClpS
MACSVRFLVLLLSLLGVTFAAFVPTSTRLVKTSVWGSSSSVLERPVVRDAVATMMSTATAIEREKVGRVGPAVLDRPAVERKEDIVPVKERKGMGSEAWEVRIYNDGLNTREHVARSLVQVTGLSELQAYQTMMQAHQNGIAVVGRWVYEVAEMFHDALKKKGIVCDIIPVEEE